MGRDLRESENSDAKTMKRNLLYSVLTGNYRDNPKSIDEMYVSRAFELHQINNILRRNDSAFIVGHRGGGKTALCYQYMNQNPDLFKDTIFLNFSHFSNSADLESLYKYLVAEIAAKEKININSHDNLLPVTNYLHKCKWNKKYLIIIDDYNLLPRRILVEFYSGIRSIMPFCKFIFVGNSIEAFINSDFYHKLHDSTVVLRGLNHNEIIDLVGKRMEFAKIKKEKATMFLELLFFSTDRYLPIPAITPRLIVQLLAEYLVSNDFQGAVKKVVEQHYGKLTNLIISEVENTLKVIPAQQIETKQVITPNSSYLISAPYIVIPNIRHLWRAQLDEFEHLLNNPNTKEKDFQHYFESNSHFLKGINYRHVIPHPVLARDNDGDLIPDFFLQPLNSNLVDILDLKLHTANLVVGSKDRLRLSREVNEAIAQLREYRSYFENPSYKTSIEEKYGIAAYKPGTVVVIGRSPKNISEEKYRQILDDKPSHVDIITFDDLHSQMRKMTEL